MAAIAAIAVAVTPGTTLLVGLLDISVLSVMAGGTMFLLNRVLNDDNRVIGNQTLVNGTNFVGDKRDLSSIALTR